MPITDGRLKRETRIALLEAVAWGVAGNGAAGGKTAVIMLVFRGAWLDGIMVKVGLETLKQLEGWIEGGVYFKELRGFSLGKGLWAFLGEEKVGRLEVWAASMGKGMLPMGSRNWELASVIVDGIREGLQGKS